MHFSKTILLLFVAIAYCSARPDDGHYTTKYDNVNVDEILHSDRLLKNYMNCLLDKGRCTPEGQTLKDNLADGLANGCGKCTEKQQKVGKKVLRFLIGERREYFEQLEAKYDPDHKYRIRYKAELEKEGIKL